MSQPRSKLKLPVDELIKTTNLAEKHTSNSSLIVQSNAELKLEVLRNSGSIPRLDNLNEITKEFALEGNWEKAESLISNMKNDCN